MKILLAGRAGGDMGSTDRTDTRGLDQANPPHPFSTPPDPAASMHQAAQTLIILISFHRHRLGDNLGISYF
jgi:hypothetical protein